MHGGGDDVRLGGWCRARDGDGIGGAGILLQRRLRVVLEDRVEGRARRGDPLPIGLLLGGRPEVASTHLHTRGSRRRYRRFDEWLDNSEGPGRRDRGRQRVRLPALRLLGNDQVRRRRLVVVRNARPHLSAVCHVGWCRRRHRDGLATAAAADGRFGEALGLGIVRRRLGLPRGAAAERWVGGCAHEVRLRYSWCFEMYCTTPSGTRYQTGEPCSTRSRQSVDDIASAGISSKLTSPSGKPRTLRS